MKTKKPKPKPAPAPVAIPPGAPVLLDMPTVAACVRIGESTLRRLRAAGSFPEPDCYVCGSARWTPSTLERWIAGQPKEAGNARVLPSKKP